jgi:lysophospholipase
MHLDPAPLIELEEDPAPKGTQAFWFEGKGGIRLRGAISPAQGEVRGSILFSPGRSEYLEKFLELARDLTARGYHFAVIDHRGQGLSDRLLKDPLKGHVRAFSDYSADLELMHAHLNEHLPGPLFLAAHSMGGLIAANVARRGKIALAGMALSAPMFGFKAGGKSMELLIGAANLLGFGTKSPPGVDGGGAQSENAAQTLTSDPVRFGRDQKRNALNQDIHLGPPTFGWLKAALKSQKRMFKKGGFDALDLPVYMASAGNEALVSNEAMRAAHKLMPDAVYENIPGALHELIEEQDQYRNRFMEGFYALLERAG